MTTCAKGKLMGCGRARLCAGCGLRGGLASRPPELSGVAVASVHLVAALAWMLLQALRGWA